MKRKTIANKTKSKKENNKRWIYWNGKENHTLGKQIERYKTIEKKRIYDLE